MEVGTVVCTASVASMVYFNFIVNHQVKQNQIIQKKGVILVQSRKVQAKHQWTASHSSLFVKNRGVCQLHRIQILRLSPFIFHNIDSRNIRSSSTVWQFVVTTTYHALTLKIHKRPEYIYLYIKCIFYFIICFFKVGVLIYSTLISLCWTCCPEIQVERLHKTSLHTEYTLLA